MNKRRRGIISEAVNHLEAAGRCLEFARDGEQDALDNMPENLQNSEKYDIMEAAVDSLDAALENVENAKSLVEDLI